jgi:hypothetical protein
MFSIRQVEFSAEPTHTDWASSDASGSILSFWVTGYSATRYPSLDPVLLDDEVELDPSQKVLLISLVKCFSGKALTSLPRPSEYLGPLARHGTANHHLQQHPSRYGPSRNMLSGIYSLI